MAARGAARSDTPPSLPAVVNLCHPTPRRRDATYHFGTALTSTTSRYQRQTGAPPRDAPAKRFGRGSLGRTLFPAALTLREPLPQTPHSHHPTECHECWNARGEQWGWGRMGGKRNGSWPWEELGIRAMRYQKHRYRYSDCYEQEPHLSLRADRYKIASAANTRMARCVNSYGAYYYWDYRTLCPARWHGSGRWRTARPRFHPRLRDPPGLSYRGSGAYWAADHGGRGRDWRHRIVRFDDPTWYSSIRFVYNRR